MFLFLFVFILGGILDKYFSLICFIIFDILVIVLFGSILILLSSLEDYFFKNSCKFFFILFEGGVGCFFVCLILFLLRKYNFKFLIMICLIFLSLDVIFFFGIFFKIFLIV